jgi:hypothetical protein
MPNSNGRKPHWQELYEAATVETDREKLSELVSCVEEAVLIRTLELAHDSDHSEERKAMDQAAEKLLIIKTEKLNWPPINVH